MSRGPCSRNSRCYLRATTCTTVSRVYSAPSQDFGPRQRRGCLTRRRQFCWRLLVPPWGLLAVVLTAMTLVIAFLDDFFGEVIEVAGTRRFFMPFVVVAFVSAADAVVAFAGALDSGRGEPAPPTSVDLEPSRMSESDLYGQETFCLESRPGCLFGLSVVRAAWSGSLSDTR
jgi:hypothetical protein